jgi:exopolysaccharide biosynthesis polyprenyl glycosylphosphotransferase
VATVSDAESQQLSDPAPLLEAVEGVLPRPASMPDRRALSARRQLDLLYVAMAITDMVSVSLGLYLASWVGELANVPRQDFMPLLALVPVLVLAMFAGFRLYATHQISPAEEFRRILLAVTLTITGLMFLSFWSNAGLSRLWLGSSWLLALVLTLSSRRLWHWFGHRARKAGLLTFPTLIVGVGGEAEHLVALLQSATLGYRPVGYVVPTGARSVGNDLPAVGHIRNLRDVIRDTGAECIFVTSSAVSLEDMSHISRAARQEGIEVRISANLPQVLSSRLAVQPVGGLMALSVKPVRLTGFQAAAKRTFDLTVSGLGVLLTLPLWGMIALLIKLTSRGPVLYRQVRVGHRNGTFTVLKFRTMVEGADSMLDSLREQNEVDGPMFKMKADPRVTRIGQWLRRCSLDELPQLLNVLKGDMSLVGPRPPLPDEVSAYEEWHLDRLEVRPGITGLWQVSGRSTLTFDQCVRMDLFYIENWSLAYDLYIMAKTIPMMLSGKGAF